ncbi:MAG: tRNA pseudouridine(55) synthase TruB [Alphaproteobacteria bacterium]
MSKHRKGNPVNGWVNFNKPVGMSSTQAVGFVRRAFNAQKAGHGGTLDPLASGVLPIALGEATKTMQFSSLEAEKEYTFTVTFGTQTATDDTEGEALFTSDKRPSLAEVQAVMPQFMGEITQLPPQYSALKIDGQAAYAIARSGGEAALKTRQVTIHSLQLTATTGSENALDSATFHAHVSKGTYIRSIARDMGQTLGCYGHVSLLTRTRAGVFALEASVSKETLDKYLKTGENPSTFLQPNDIALADILAYVAEPKEVHQLKAGVLLQRVHLQPGLRRVVTKHGVLVSLVDIDQTGTLRIVRNFNNE